METETLIRDATAGDEAAWRTLWADYIAFYKAAVPEAVTALTWSRALDPTSPVIIRLAVAGDGGAVGFSASVIHLATWSAAPVCYLEDLFVAPGARGRRVGKALIDDLAALGVERRWSRLYWHTRQSNHAARSLYDRFAAADDFVRYRLALDPSD
jgi:ribosomal protein S18 acetylase RimI-like enzyme